MNSNTTQHSNTTQYHSKQQHTHKHTTKTHNTTANSNTHHLTHHRYTNTTQRPGTAHSQGRRHSLFNAGPGEPRREIGGFWRDTIVVVLERILHPEPPIQTLTLLIRVILLQGRRGRQGGRDEAGARQGKAGVMQGCSEGKEIREGSY